MWYIEYDIFCSHYINMAQPINLYIAFIVTQQKYVAFITSSKVYIAYFRYFDTI